MWPYTPSKGYEQALEDASLASEPASSNAIDKAPSQPPSITGHLNARLSIPFPVRLPLSVGVGLLSGFVLGTSKGGSEASYRYRAENAHRLPTTQTGWYLYHKSKNYHSIVGGVKEGLLMGGRLSAWAALFVSSEEVIDQLRGEGDDRQRDTASTVCAAMTTAGLYSWMSGSDMFTAARIAKVALKVSLIYGLSQDLVSTLGGKQPAYVDWLMRHVLGKRDRLED